MQEKKKYSKAVQRRAREIFESENQLDFVWSSIVVNEIVGFKKPKKPLSHAQRERYLRQAEKEVLKVEKAEAKTKTKAKDKADKAKH